MAAMINYTIAVVLKYFTRQQDCGIISSKDLFQLVFLSSPCSVFTGFLTRTNGQERISLINTSTKSFKQTSDENEEKYQLGHYEVIQYQALRSKIMRIVL